MKKLGFGMMRLPLTDSNDQGSISLEHVCRMVDAFLAAGYTYFDTAYMYHSGQSERAVRDALVARHSRDSFTLADKLPLFHIKAEDGPQRQEEIFADQLDKCGVDYFDYYLLHALNAQSYETAQRLDSFGFIAQKKAQGRIRRIGFSFHDKAEVLDRILTSHPEVEFVQLQINYLDWEDERVQSRKCYETVRRHGKQVVIMEPVKGGKLAALPEEAAAPLRAAHPDWSPASWALRFAAGLDGVLAVLSGMSNMEQVTENTGFMTGPAPLTAGEQELLAEAARVLAAQPAVPCTACRYCVDGCPRSVPIPELFELYNADQLALRRGGDVDRERYQAVTRDAGRASSCISCRQCEQQCPQHLPVTQWLEKVKKAYEG